MRTLLSADAIRAARSLAGLSQREAAVGASMTQKTIWMAESNAPPGTSINTKLREFYENLGIEFLGTVDLATGQARGIGARWRIPPQLPDIPTALVDFHSEYAGVAFAAARALLNKKQAEITALSGVPQRKVGALETSTVGDQATTLRLRSFYEREGIEFLGWGDVTSGMFYGVGVRWRMGPVPESPKNL